MDSPIDEPFVGDSLRESPAARGASGLHSGILLVCLPALAAALLHLGFLVKYALRYGGDPSALVCAGRCWQRQFPYEAVTTTISERGYDGQHYYALARDPWTRHDHGIDSPAARHLRILYPALCWLLSGGDARALFWVMPAVNLVAITALAGLGAWLARRHGMSPWWGFVLPLALNAALPALRNLTDPLSTLALFGMLTAWLVRGPAWVIALCALAAVFSREQNTGIVLLLLVAALWVRRHREVAGLALALLAWAGWVAALGASYGVWPFLPGQGNFAWPLEGFLFRWAHLDYPSGSRREALLHLAAMLLLTLQCLLTAYLCLRASGGRVALLVALAGVALAALGGIFLYEDAWSYLRVLVWLPLGLWLAGLQTRRGWVLLLLAPDVVSTLAMIRIV